jgi:hypothetical protein
MIAAAIALAAFAGFPASPTPQWALLSVTGPTGWADIRLLFAGRPRGVSTSPENDALAPAASAIDEPLDEPLDDGTPRLRLCDLHGCPDGAAHGDAAPHVALIGCELALAGGLDPQTWWMREMWVGAPVPRIVANGHTERSGRWIKYEQIPRRPERPEAYTAYRYPVTGATLVSGYDLDKPDRRQRRGRMRAVGHGGLDLAAKMGAPIAMPRLEHQVGDAEVLYVGHLYGTTVVTRHVVREGGADHDYLLLFGHLHHAGAGARRGRRLREGATVGYVGDSDSPRQVHLHLEVRRVRDGIDTRKLRGDAICAREYTVVSDPRNVLPLVDQPPPVPTCAPRVAAVAAPSRAYWLGAGMALSLGGRDVAGSERPISRGSGRVASPAPWVSALCVTERATDSCH